VNGEGASDLYKWLKDKNNSNLPGTRVSYNYGKFLIGPDGKEINYYSSTEEPEEMEEDILDTL